MPLQEKNRKDKNPGQDKWKGKHHFCREAFETRIPGPKTQLLPFFLVCPLLRSFQKLHISTAQHRLLLDLHQHTIACVAGHQRLKDLASLGRSKKACLGPTGLVGSALVMIPYAALFVTHGRVAQVRPRMQFRFRAPQAPPPPK